MTPSPRETDDNEAAVRALFRPGLREAVRLVDEAIFDLPIGNDVTYSRGYSAGIAAARDSFREALYAALRGPHDR